ncbi:MAG: hypothetical protein D6738_06660 [Acidobacteria bacterium]|nr:MAG: hypothetical protein D6738_06660 [Acidobacteriota bacterium]
MSAGAAARVQRGWSHDFGEEVTALAWSGSGRLLALGGGRGRLTLLGDGGRLLVTEAAHTGRVEELSFVPDSERLVSCGEDGWLRWWQPGHGGSDGRLELDGPATRLAVRRDGRRIAVATRRRVLVADDAAQLVCATVDLGSTFEGLAWCAGGRRVAVATGGDGLVLVDAVSGRCVVRDGRIAAGRVAAAGGGSLLVVEDREARGRLVVLELQGDRIARGAELPAAGPDTRFSVCADGGLLAVLGGQTLAIWKLDGRPRRLAREPAPGAQTVAFTADGCRLAVAGPRFVELRDPESAAVLTRVDGLPDGRPRLAWAVRRRRGAALARATDSGQVDVFDVR